MWLAFRGKHKIQRWWLWSAKHEYMPCPPMHDVCRALIPICKSTADVVFFTKVSTQTNQPYVDSYILPSNFVCFSVKWDIEVKPSVTTSSGNRIALKQKQLNKDNSLYIVSQNMRYQSGKNIEKFIKKKKSKYFSGVLKGWTYSRSLHISYKYVHASLYSGKRTMIA